MKCPPFVKCNVIRQKCSIFQGFFGKFWKKKGAFNSTLWCDDAIKSFGKSSNDELKMIWCLLILPLTTHTWSITQKGVCKRGGWGGGLPLWEAQLDQTTLKIFQFLRTYIRFELLRGLLRTLCFIKVKNSMKKKIFSSVPLNGSINSTQL